MTRQFTEQTIADALRQARNDALDSAIGICEGMAALGKTPSDCCVAIHSFKYALSQPGDPVPEVAQPLDMREQS